METNRDRDESIASFIRDAIAQRQQALSQLLKAAINRRIANRMAVM